MEIGNIIYNFIQENSNIDYLELYGFRISLDDLLLIGIIYILYKENCNDQFLYVVLIMLLLDNRFLSSILL